MIAAILRRVRLAAAAVFAFGAVLIGVFVVGRSSGKAKADNATLRGHIKTREKTDAADLPSDADDARRRMLARDPNKR